MYRYYIQYFVKEDGTFDKYENCGVIAAASYGEAVTKLEKYYKGPDDVIGEIKIFEMEDCIENEEFKELLNEEYN